MPDDTPATGGDAEALDGWETYLSDPVRDRKVIVAFEVLAGMTGVAAQLRRWGAQRPLLIADGRGTGPVPDSSEAEIVVLPTPNFESVTEQVRDRIRPAERLTPDVTSAVESYDPEGTAVWWLNPVCLNEPLLERRVLGGRPRRQAALEDKLILDDLLDATGTERTPSRVVPAAYHDLTVGSDQLVEEATSCDATGNGTTTLTGVVWAGDNHEGPNGAGDYVRWIRSPQQAREASAFFGRHCRRVRISLFLEGVPCSIHGIVLPDGVVVLRPVELVTLREPETGLFVYGGMGTTWSPPEADATHMRDLTRRLGIHLRRAHGYRGGFCIDGVLTADGFRVTEVNTRFSGALARLHRAAPEAQLELVHLNALLDRDVGRSAAAIEDQALALLDANRFVDAMGLSRNVVIAEPEEVPVRVGEDRLEVAESDESTIGSVLAGPSALGSFFRFAALDGIVRPGERAAPLTVLLHEFADRTWGAGFHASLIAPDVRRRG
ncbi:MAG TPA: hypothetical protein VH419_16390 [Nocardioidaceae bacterium]